jgi:hypothetical protein
MSPDNGRNYSQVQLYNNGPAGGVNSYFNSEEYPQVSDTVQFLAHVTQVAHSVCSILTVRTCCFKIPIYINLSFHTHKGFRTAVLKQRV